MRTNADITLYHWNGTGYGRTHIAAVWWEHNRISNVNKTGLQNADSVLILIPLVDSTTNLEIVTGKDLVVKGNCELTIDSTSQQTQSASINALKSSNQVFTVTSFDPKLYGSTEMQHYELSCK